VSIDIEGRSLESADKGPVRELGVSVFDTRILQNSAANDPYSAISTFIYTTDRNRFIRKKGTNPREMCIFRHGPSQYIEERWLGWLLDKFLRNGSPDPACTEVRNTVLVGHSIGGDIGLLTKRGGRFKFSLSKFPNVLVLDTAIIAQRWVVGTRKLKYIMKELRVGYKGNDLHCGGNDAWFTLRTLLMMAIYEDIKMGNELQPTSKFLETVACANRTDRLAKHLEYIALTFFEDYGGPLIQDFQVPVDENMEEAGT
jgi:hypothetical protein